MDNRPERRTVSHQRADSQLGEKAGGIEFSIRARVYSCRKHLLSNVELYRLRKISVKGHEVSGHGW